MARYTRIYILMNLAFWYYILILLHLLNIASEVDLNILDIIV